MKPCQIDQSKLDTKAGTHDVGIAKRKKKKKKECVYCSKTWRENLVDK